MEKALNSIVKHGSAKAGELLQVEKVSKIYREGDHDRLVLDEASISINYGQIAAILGKSGSGKTTLLNIISGIDLPTSGRVTIGGVDLTNMSERERTLFRRQNIGFIFQFFNLIPTITVEENLLLPLELNRRTEKEARQSALEILASFGLSHRVHSFPDTLSGGEQQRVAIARALANDPLLLLADEPTGNLDSVTGQEVLGRMVDITRKSGKTMIIVTHDREAATVADVAYTINKGKLVEIK